MRASSYTLFKMYKLSKQMIKCINDKYSKFKHIIKNKENSTKRHVFIFALGTYILSTGNMLKTAIFLFTDER